jgi:hypothetical protein
MRTVRVEEAVSPVLSVATSVLPGSPADFGKLFSEEVEKWGKVIKFAGIKAD